MQRLWGTKKASGSGTRKARGRGMRGVGDGSRGPRVQGLGFWILPSNQWEVFKQGRDIDPLPKITLASLESTDLMEAKVSRRPWGVSL